MPKTNRVKNPKPKSRMDRQGSSTLSNRPMSNTQKPQSFNFAPVSTTYSGPEPGFDTAPPRTKGACARYLGCDFLGSDPSSSSAPQTGAVFVLTASNATSFPRLAAIADVFLRYRFNRLRFHFIGRSSSTQAGVGAWASFILDEAVSAITVNTESIIKNAEGARTLKGWDSGFHDVDVDASGVLWHNTDNSAASSTYGALCHYIQQTTANGDLSWDVFVEYDVEFSEPVAGASVNLQKKKQGTAQTECTEETDLLNQLMLIKQKLEALEKERERERTPKV